MRGDALAQIVFGRAHAAVSAQTLIERKPDAAILSL
jgi:hypothetical protein